jgi:HAD superfamily hydrolase (TIGR01509 family)
MTLRALIFDVDGTLAETEELHRLAFNAAFAAAGLDWHWDQPLYGRLLAVTGGKERIAHFQDVARLPHKLDAPRIAALHADKTARYAALVASGDLPLRPGVRRLLREARAAGLRLAIATTTSRPNVDALLSACSPLPVFDVIAAGDEVPRKKPAPDIYVAALHRLGLSASDCLAIEDTENGLKSAAAACLACLITISAYGGTGPFEGAAAVVSDLGEPDATCRVHAGPPTRIVDLTYCKALHAHLPPG